MREPDLIGLLGANICAYPLNPQLFVDPMGLVTEPKNEKNHEVPDSGDITRDIITNRRDPVSVLIGDNAVYDACRNNGRIMTCMEKLDQYEQIAGADKSLGKHPLIQVTVELARELGKNSVCMINNKCDILEYVGGDLPEIWPPDLDTVFKEIPKPSAGPKKKDRIN